ncbi:unnamed protein product [Phytophthora fragariaefolia]|uniref:Unnamed protein product n=1 Tax=Phytophthora fragariaefolia TaxID=1490495 RepID=A0A9W7D2A5_9STRA|nr:unnamed protein product [Phytophthora fragariaefolia]
MQDYLINWNAGPLGVVLRPDLGADMPPVVAQLLPQPSVLKLAGVREGDLLISVNGKKTTRLGYEKVRRKHKKKSKHGAKAEAEERRLRKQYSVVWERGSLGISFRAYNSKVNVPCVDFISASRGQGRGMDRVCVNDVLIAINGEKTKALGVEKVLRWLHVVEKPVVLRFHASSNRIVNPAGGLLPHLADDDDASARPRRPTLSSAQPEYEPAPRPPRRNNSVDQQHRPDRRYSDDKEYELGPTGARSEGRRHSRDSATHFEQQPIDDYEPQFHLPAASTEAKDMRYSANSMNAYARGRGEDGVAGDFRREPVDDEEDQFDPRFDAHITPHRRPHEEAHMSFEEAADVVARAAGKPMEECEFGGVPLLNIKEGTVQAKLMFIYAKACLAKEGSSDDEPVSKDPQLPRTPGNPLGRKTHSKYLSYTILQDDTVASKNNANGNDGDMVEHEMEQKADFKKSGIFGHNLDESFAKMQKDISIQPPAATPPLSSLGPSSSAGRDATPSVNTSSVPPTSADDFISLKDFVVKVEGSLTEQHAASSAKSSTSPGPSANGVEVDGVRADEHQKKQSSEAAGANATEVSSDLEVTATESKVAIPEAKENEELTAGENTKEEDLPQVVELEENDAEQIELAKDADEVKTPEHLDDDDDAASVDSSNERDLAASVASLDDLLDIPLKGNTHDDEEHEEFVDDDEDDDEDESKRTDDKETLKTSLGLKLDQVQEEESGETETLEEHQKHDEQVEQVEHDQHEHEEEEEYEDGALSNPLVNELYRTIPDVREVIKDKPALVVLVKKSMIDEIQEILQSLQMELQFERHSTVAIGSTALPLGESHLGRNTEGQHCYRCGATGELAELDVAGGQRELFCQECWEMFFFSEDRQSPVARTSKTLAPSEVGRLTADEDALDDALKYSFHDSSITREDMIHPWRYRMGSDSLSSSIRDSSDSTITDRTDEVWLFLRYPGQLPPSLHSPGRAAPDQVSGRDLSVLGPPAKMVLPAASLAIRSVVDTVTTMPRSVLKHMEQTLLWSVPPEPKGPMWADDVFTTTKSVSIAAVVACIEDELTDSCSSGVFSSDEDAGWSSDEVSIDGCSDDEDEDNASCASYAYQGERWYWTPPSSTNSVQSYEEKYETASQRSADLDEFGLEHGDDHYRRPTMYAMPSIDFGMDGVVDSWVDRYGSNRPDFTYVATLPERDSDNESQEPRALPPHLAGFYIPLLFPALKGADSNVETNKLQRTTENAQVAVALLARTFRAVVGLPWSTLELLDRAMRWGSEPEVLEDSAAAIWAEDLFAPCSTKCWLPPSNDDITDSSGSEKYDDEDEGDEWTCSESEEELDGFGFVGDRDIDIWGDRWFWTPCQSEDEVEIMSSIDTMDVDNSDTSSYNAERMVDYVMPSMDPATDAAIESWIEKYGSSRLCVRFVAMPMGEPRTIDAFAFVLPSSSSGLFVAVL